MLISRLRHIPKLVAGSFVNALYLSPQKTIEHVKETKNVVVEG
jgi:hypothetical protein